MKRYTVQILLFCLGSVGFVYCNEPTSSLGQGDTESESFSDSTGDLCHVGAIQECQCPDGKIHMVSCQDGQFPECPCSDTDGGDTSGDSDVLPVFCSDCHGSVQNSAPPVNTTGESATSLMSVGAHQKHLQGGDWHRRVTCSECHLVPEQLNSPGHIDGSPAELIWGPIATSANMQPTFNSTSGICSNVYCHGAGLIEGGGENIQPRWTAVDVNEVVCGDCHGLPPGGDHSTSSACGNCHGAVYDGANWVNASLHINGQVESSSMSCTSCHGGVNGNSAPPVDTLGGTSTSLMSVGAHQAHVNSGTTWHGPIGCTDCHVSPSQWDNGHADGVPAEITWGSLALSDNAAGNGFDSSTGKCSTIYCHGATLMGGGTNSDPIWNQVGTDQAACGTCHGLPPDSPHTTDTDCSRCHPNVAADNGSFTTPSDHINGTVDVSGGFCSSCHGYPPEIGNESYPGTAGAHDVHLARGYACDVCHGHNGSGSEHNQGSGTVDRVNVDVAFDSSLVFFAGTTINNGGTATESYNAGDPTCAVGCHNPVVGESADLANVVNWNDGPLNCTACHEHVAVSSPEAHNISADPYNYCLECHNNTNHTQGSAELADPDVTDGITVSASNPATLCHTCHDGDGNTYFGSQTPAAVTTYITTDGSHANAGYDCLECHGYHGTATGGTLTADGEETLCLSCHDGTVAGAKDMATRFGLYSHHHINDSEQLVASPVECVSCHDPHGNPAVSLLVDPHTRDSIAVIDLPHDSSEDLSVAANDRGTFCLSCHDGSWDGAKNIQNELDQILPYESAFTDSKGASEHASHEDDPNKIADQMACTYCHNAHGSTGPTSDTDVEQRGALLYDWITVKEFPYKSKQSCGTPATVACHGGG